MPLFLQFQVLTPDVLHAEYVTCLDGSDGDHTRVGEVYRYLLLWEDALFFAL